MDDDGDGKVEVEVVPRDEWGAIPMEARTPLQTPVDSVVLAYNTDMDVSTERDVCLKQMTMLQHSHIESGELDVAYNFMMCGDGRMYEGRGWKWEHSPTLRYPQSYGKAVVIGMFGPRKEHVGSGQKVDTPDSTEGPQGFVDLTTVDFSEFEKEAEEGVDLMVPTLEFIRKSYQDKYIKDPMNVYEDHCDHFAG